MRNIRQWITNQLNLFPKKKKTKVLFIVLTRVEFWQESTTEEEREERLKGCSAPRCDPVFGRTSFPNKTKTFPPRPLPFLPYTTKCVNGSPRKSPSRNDLKCMILYFTYPQHRYYFFHRVSKIDQRIKLNKKLNVCCSMLVSFNWKNLQMRTEWDNTVSIGSFYSHWRVRHIYNRFQGPARFTN